MVTTPNGRTTNTVTAERGSAEMLVIGLSAALILVVALPLVTDVRDQTDHGI